MTFKEYRATLGNNVDNFDDNNIQSAYEAGVKEAQERRSDDEKFNDWKDAENISYVIKLQHEINALRDEVQKLTREVENK